MAQALTDAQRNQLLETYFRTRVETAPEAEGKAELRAPGSKTPLTFAQRQLLSNLYGSYNEARTARSEADMLRSSADLAAENLRLNTLRYRAGEATVLELVDAESMFTQAQNAYADGMARYRVALATLQTLTGDF